MPGLNVVAAWLSSQEWRHEWQERHGQAAKPQASTAVADDPPARAGRLRLDSFSSRGRAGRQGAACPAGLLLRSLQLPTQQVALWAAKKACREVHVGPGAGKAGAQGLLRHQGLGRARVLAKGAPFMCL